MAATRTPSEGRPAREAGDGAPWRTEKVQARHRDRLAVVYVRQSSLQQVQDHRESTRLQYGLAARADALGWPAEQVLVIDDDLGKSAASADGRAGFQRLVAEVGLDRVGIILGVEMSRLARSCRDWYQLLEVCALFGTLIADLDGIYDPGQYNDRLLLGLKGTMSEAELHIMQQRLRQGLLAKARRGELCVVPPLGYVRRPTGEIALDPDEQVQAVVRLIFRTFDELGTVHATLRYLVRHRVQVGMRAHGGPGRGEVVWRRPNRVTLQNLLKHPTYAGAYVYGRRRVDPRRQRGREEGQRAGGGRAGGVAGAAPGPGAGVPELGGVRAEPGAAGGQPGAGGRAGGGAGGAGAAGRPARLRRLRPAAGGAVQGCDAVRLRLRRAGERLWRAAVPAAGRGRPGRLRRRAGAGRAGAGRAGAVAGGGGAPGAGAGGAGAAVAAAAGARGLRGGARGAAVPAGRAREPAGRAQPGARPGRTRSPRDIHLEEEHRQALQVQPRGLAAAERAAIRRLAADIPALWHAATTTAAERKEIVRQVVQRVVVAVQGESERVLVAIEWAGGARTDGEIARPVARFEPAELLPRAARAGGG